MPYALHDADRLLARVRRMKGQIAALERALQDDKECAAVLQQIAALRGAANGFMAEVFEQHLREHLGPEHSSAQSREQHLAEVARIAKRYFK
jgi:DNA-binding FrmR family transcriptional regulator